MAKQTVSMKLNDLPPAHILEMTGMVKSLALPECKVEVNWLGIRVQAHVMTCCTNFKICRKAHSQPMNSSSVMLPQPSAPGLDYCWNMSLLGFYHF